MRLNPMVLQGNRIISNFSPWRFLVAFVLRMRSPRFFDAGLARATSKYKAVSGYLLFFLLFSLFFFHIRRGIRKHSAVFGARARVALRVDLHPRNIIPRGRRGFIVPT